MTSNDFCYWLNGFFELSNGTTLTDEQVNIIRDHLNLVFKKETPYYYTPSIFPAKLFDNEPFSPKITVSASC
jgi:hypothetical protein